MLHVSCAPAEEHGPLLPPVGLLKFAETIVNPVGRVSVTVTPDGSGPLFVTLVVKVTFPPGATDDCDALATTAISAPLATFTVCEAVLSAGFESPTAAVSLE